MLCWDLHLPYEDLSGSGHQTKVLELIDYCRRNGRLADLIATCRRERPHVSWNFAAGI
jgi:hypothetical protein